MPVNSSLSICDEHSLSLDRLTTQTQHQLRLRRLHANWSKIPKNQLKVIGQHLPYRVERFRNTSGAVWTENHLLCRANRMIFRTRLGRKDIGCCSKISLGNLFGKFIEIDNRGPTHKEHTGSFPDQLELTSSEKALVLTGDSCKNEYAVGSREHLIERCRGTSTLLNHTFWQPRVVYLHRATERFE